MFEHQSKWKNMNSRGYQNHWPRGREEGRQADAVISRCGVPWYPFLCCCCKLWGWQCSTLNIYMLAGGIAVKMQTQHPRLWRIPLDLRGICWQTQGRLCVQDFSDGYKRTSCVSSHTISRSKMCSAKGQLRSDRYDVGRAPWLKSCERNGECVGKNNGLSHSGGRPRLGHPRAGSFNVIITIIFIVFIFIIIIITTICIDFIIFITIYIYIYIFFRTLVWSLERVVTSVGSPF